MLTHELDPQAFFATYIIRRKKHPNVISQLSSEYYFGNYGNVISICRRVLADSKFDKQQAYLLWGDLVLVYFDVGDYENLKKAYEEYINAMSFLKEKTHQKILKSHLRTEAIRLYMNEEYENCLQLLDKHNEYPLRTYMNTFIKAKIALAMNNREEARRYFETVIKDAPKMNIAKLSLEYLAKMDALEEDGDITSLSIDICESDSEVEICSVGNRKFKILRAISMLFALLFVLLGVNWMIYYGTRDQRYREFFHNFAYLLVEKDYDYVEVLETFDFIDDGEILDNMFIFKTDEQIIVAGFYVIEGDNTVRYDKLTSLPLEELKNNRTAPMRVSFSTITTDYKVYGYFYFDESDVPTEYIHKSVIDAEGKKVYFVVTEIYAK